ncbi:hypothetical protein T492DRAFT_615041 [Pavlovales sp. CCMP2436]|nr:hypothetical protein T492DRAFT_615041 [Pavlovales sp. CCMP2436]
MAALAFDNGLPEMEKYKDRPKQRGPKPADIGLKARLLNADGDEALGSVKTCAATPNCFTTTGDRDISTAPPGESGHLLPTWLPPKGATAAAAMSELESVVKAYKPGQAGIDGGGFEIVTSSDTYLYAQFASLRQGYVDDVEFAPVADYANSPAVQVRSASRLGYLDYAVNAMRLNYISKELRAKGWTSPEITTKTHPEYFGYNLPKPRA